MDCNEFWKKYGESGLIPELEKHLEDCVDCGIELKSDDLLARTVSSLPEHNAPDGLWLKISAACAGEKKRIPLLNSFTEKLKALFSLPSKPAIAAFSLLFIVIMGIGYHYFSSLRGNDITLKREEILKELKQTEDEYLSAIEKFSRLAENGRDSIDTELYQLYEEKLTLLDASIDECREAIQQNRFDLHAQLYLFAAYKEKVETLKKMSEKTGYF